MNQKEWRDWRRELVRPGEKAVIAWLSNGRPALEFMTSVIRSYQLDVTKGVGRFSEEGWYISGRSGVNISHARNRIAYQFLHLPHKPEWLWLVDDDMRWPADSFEKLLTQARPDRIIGGLCFAYGPEGRVIPTIFFRDELGRHKAVDEDYKIPSDSLLQVAGTGAAFLVVHRDALIEIAKQTPRSPNPWFREHEMPVTDQETGKIIPWWVSEDLFFCDMAERAGISIWIHTGVEVAHRKPHWLTRSLYESDTSAMEWA